MAIDATGQGYIPSGPTSTAGASSVASVGATSLQTMTLAALNARMVVDVAGMASAMILVEGTATMTLKFSGTVAADNAGPAGRRLWKAGVGSLGVSTLNYTGAVSSEYRAVLGGRFLSIECTSYTSGSLNVTVLSEAGSPIVFVHGPVHDAIEEAARAGKLYNAATGMQAVGNGNFLNFRFENPATSGRMAYVYNRRLDNNIAAGSTPAEYGGISTPVALAGATTATPRNQRTGSPTSPMLCTWNVSATRLNPAVADPAPIGGVLKPSDGTFLETLRIVPPGTMFGVFMGGAGGGLSAAARMGQAWFWYEEDEF